MKRQNNQHQWSYMGVDTETGEEYCYCDLCKIFASNQSVDILKNPRKTISSKDKSRWVISAKFYRDRNKQGKIVIR